MRRRDVWKPALGARINYGHPLAVGLFDCLLFNEGGGQKAINLTVPRGNASGTSSPSWKPTPRGIAAYCTGGASFDVPDHGNIAAGAFTFRALIRPDTWTAGGFAILCDKGGGSRELSIFFDTAGNVSRTDAGLTGSSSSIPTGMTAGQVWDLVAVRPSASAGIVSFYVNGVFKGSTGATVTGVAAQAGSVLALGRSTTGGTSFDGKYITVQTWLRALQPDEIQRLYREPYAFLNQPSRPGAKAAASQAQAFFFQRYVAERARA